MPACIKRKFAYLERAFHHEPNVKFSDQTKVQTITPKSAWLLEDPESKRQYHIIKTNVKDKRFDLKIYTENIMTPSSPAIAYDTIFFGSPDGHLYAVEAKNGKLRWKFATKGKIYSSPVVADGNVYIGSSDKYFYALDAHNGQLKWKFATQGEIWSSAAVAGGIVYITSQDGYLYALH